MLRSKCCYGPEEMGFEQALAQAQAQIQAAHQELQAQAAQQQAQGQQGALGEGVPVQANPTSPGVDPPGFTYRNRSRRKASEKPVVRSLSSCYCVSSHWSLGCSGGRLWLQSPFPRVH